ncbi:hypothetical protein [Roseovarius ramblicola]|uniref:Uncharacterized protein n=1 Tax=Roseovarius ramblicola TaxID=2022336 RepID=A0ABV5HYR1_9RHOB
MTRLDDAQRAALLDAYHSINHGGLVEVSGARGWCWVGENPACTEEHRPHVIGGLDALGLLDRTGRAPMRRATISEWGIKELDCAGMAA